MSLYYVNKNKQPNGDHEVHKSECNHIPDSSNRIYLGSFTNCRDAVKEANLYFDQVDGCYYCSEPCHTS